MTDKKALPMWMPALMALASALFVVADLLRGNGIDVPYAIAAVAFAVAAVAFWQVARKGRKP